MDFKMRRFVFVVVCGFYQSVFALGSAPDLQFDVVRYELTGANPLLPEVVTKVLKPYLGRHYGLDGLSSAVAELEKALKADGYSFHRVILQPQSLRQGIVKLRVYEFKLGSLKVTGQRFFSEENIKRSLPSLIQNRAPNTRLLNRSLVVANEHPDKSIQMVFKEGEKINTIDIDLTVADKSPHTSYMQLSNTGSEETGEGRLGVGYQYSNLFDKDHIVGINYSTSLEQPESVAQYILSYSLPFYEMGNQLSFFYSDSEIETSSLLGSIDLDIYGAGKVFGSRYKIGFKKIKGYEQKLTLGLDYKEFENEILVANNPAGGTNELKSSPLSIEYSVSKSQRKDPFNVSVSLFRNIVEDQTAYDEEANTPDTEWYLIRYRAQYDLPLPNGSLMRFKLDGQATDQPLITSEQYGVGGSQSVRGYEERATLGDSGYSLSTEYLNNSAANNINWLIFYDMAQTVYEVPAVAGVYVQNISSIGVGIRWTWKRYVNISADIAQVQEDFGAIQSGDSKLHFNLTYQY